jgi:hypothetical protein
LVPDDHPTLQPVVILYWTEYYSAVVPLADWRRHCPQLLGDAAGGRCVLTADRSQLPAAGAVVFHSPDFKPQDISLIMGKYKLYVINRLKIIKLYLNLFLLLN